ncbi:innexin inx3-like [Adelges cooleyi]|uniref:innexin inx3-like n=1 Tax=Adelges cooleyi TaxID=133065 RepID=UPI0021803A76|nr:innexin inx3-like [Adelges cooleyi]XP_050424116.1 innexin inx3-like [Adelges cooleyi]XP_050424117.1 innexin inx3-like [Adelges cooleyi]XP_050424118.1 innexin inx3-like [Adelges cooleyi]
MVLITALKVISKPFKVCNDRPVIDNYLFQCHYKLTTNVLFTFCILVTANSLIGEPIECISTFSKKPDIQKAINKYCWVSSTFTVVRPEDTVRFDPLHSVGQVDKKCIRRHSYYQWVPFMLFLQAIAFYVPHWLWKIWEGGKIRMITEGMRGHHMDTVADRKTKINRLVQYCLYSRHTHNTYAYRYFLCEVFNMVIIFGNIYITNTFLGGTFLTYGLEILKYNQGHDIHSVDNSPMENVFPKITKCVFYKYGPSGSIQNNDALCILSQNNLNEKIYLFLWFWFIVIAILSNLALLYRFAYITLSVIKRNQLVKMLKFTNNKYELTDLIKKLQIGDFLLLYFIGKNIHFMNFKILVEELSAQVKLNTLTALPSLKEENSSKNMNLISI